MEESSGLDNNGVMKFTSGAITRYPLALGDPGNTNNFYSLFHHESLARESEG